MRPAGLVPGQIVPPLKFTGLGSPPADLEPGQIVPSLEVEVGWIAVCSVYGDLISYCEYFANFNHKSHNVQSLFLIIIIQGDKVHHIPFRAEALLLSGDVGCILLIWDIRQLIFHRI